MNTEASIYHRTEEFFNVDEQRVRQVKALAESDEVLDALRMYRSGLLSRYRLIALILSANAGA